MNENGFPGQWQVAGRCCGGDGSFRLLHDPSFGSPQELWLLIGSESACGEVTALFEQIEVELAPVAAAVRSS